MTDISPHRPLYVTLKTIGTTVCSHNSSMRYRFRFEDRKLNNFLVVKPSVPVIPYFLSRKSVSLCQYEYLNQRDGKLTLVKLFRAESLPVAALSKAWTCLMEFRVRIPPVAWVSTSCDCRMFSGRGLCDGPITSPEESYRLWFVFIMIVEPHTGVLGPLGLSSNETQILKIISPQQCHEILYRLGRQKF